DRQIVRIGEVIRLDAGRVERVRRPQDEAATAPRAFQYGADREAVTLRVRKPVLHVINRTEDELQVRRRKARTGRDEATGLADVRGQRSPTEEQVIEDVPERLRARQRHRPRASVNHPSEEMVLKVLPYAGHVDDNVDAQGAQ